MQSFRQLPRAASTARAFSTTVPRPLARMQLIGRLADTPVAQATSTGRDLIRYTLGVPAGPKDEEGNRPVSWFRISNFVNEGQGRQRDLLLSLPKGTQIYVEAEAKWDTYTAQDGSQRTALNLLQRSFEALSRPQHAHEATAEAEAETTTAAEPEAAATTAA